MALRSNTPRTPRTKYVILSRGPVSPTSLGLDGTDVTPLYIVYAEEPLWLFVVKPQYKLYPLVYTVLLAIH